MLRGGFFLKHVESLPHYRYEKTIMSSLRLSIEELSSDQKELVFEIAAALAEGQSMTESEVIKLWKKNAGLDKNQSLYMLRELRARALINHQEDEPDTGKVTLHPLIHKFLREISR